MYASLNKTGNVCSGIGKLSKLIRMIQHEIPTGKPTKVPLNEHIVRVKYENEGNLSNPPQNQITPLSKLNLDLKINEIL